MTYSTEPCDPPAYWLNGDPVPSRVRPLPAQVDPVRVRIKIVRVHDTRLTGEPAVVMKEK